MKGIDGNGRMKGKSDVYEELTDERGRRNGIGRNAIKSNNKEMVSIDVCCGNELGMDRDKREF